MSELLKINVNAHTEKKGGLTYLSWAWAWSEILKIDPAARYTVHEWDGKPVCYLKDDTALVKVSVEVNGVIKTCLLPVMDNRNRSIVNPNSFAVNTAIMRCMTKCVSLFGLGLYIFAGEDTPTGEPVAPTVNDELVADIQSAPTLDELTKLFKALDKEQRMAHIDFFTQRKKELAPPPEAA